MNPQGKPGQTFRPSRVLQGEAVWGSPGSPVVLACLHLLLHPLNTLRVITVTVPTPRLSLSPRGSQSACPTYLGVLQAQVRMKVFSIFQYHLLTY